MMSKSVRKFSRDLDKFRAGESKIRKMKRRKENKKMRGLDKRGSGEVY